MLNTTMSLSLLLHPLDSNNWDDSQHLVDIFGGGCFDLTSHHDDVLGNMLTLKNIVWSISQHLSV